MTAYAFPSASLSSSMVRTPRLGAAISSCASEMGSEGEESKRWWVGGSHRGIAGGLAAYGALHDDFALPVGYLDGRDFHFHRAAAWLMFAGFACQAAAILVAVDAVPENDEPSVKSVRSGAVYGRLSVGKGFFERCRCWLVRPCIRPVGAAYHVPLAIMPFARLRSRS